MKPTYTEKETRLLVEFRVIVADVLEDEYDQTDEFLISWIRFGRLDLKKAEQLLRTNKKWRKENNLDNILLEDFTAVADDFPLEIAGFDKVGCPVVGAKLDRDVRKILSRSGGREQLIRYVTSYMEKTVTIIKTQYEKTDGSVCRFTAVVDMDDFVFAQITSSKAISTLVEIAKIAETNYPGRVKTLYVVNAPRMFKIILNVFKPFLSADTVSRIKLLDWNREKWTKELLDHIDADQLPAFLNIPKDPELLNNN